MNWRSIWPLIRVAAPPRRKLPWNSSTWGVFVDLDGVDLHYFGSRGTGTIALGEHHRGAGLLLAYLTIGVLVTFVRIRPWWQLLVLAAAAPLIVLLCNLMRLIFWGLVTIYGGADALSAVPRTAATVMALLLAWGLFAGLSALASRIVVHEAPVGSEEP